MSAPAGRNGLPLPSALVYLFPSIGSFVSALHAVHLEEKAWSAECSGDPLNAHMLRVLSEASWRDVNPHIPEATALRGYP